MTQAIEIAKLEHGVIRVFSLSLTRAEALALKDDAEAVAQALGAPAVDLAHVEIFPVTDLEGVGLPGYLMEGGAVPEAQIAPDRRRLEALDGWVLVLFSRAFADQPLTLRPQPELTLIGTYGEIPRDYAGEGKVQAAAAQPYTAPPVPAKKKRSDAAMSGMVATAVLILLGIFTAIIIWIA